MTSHPSLAVIGPPPAAFNMAAYVLGQADKAPDKTALRVITSTTSDDWSYAALKQAVFGTAHGLQNMGLRPGDRLLMRVGNTPDFPVVFLAAILIGVIPIPTSAQLTQAEVTQIAKDTQPQLIVIADGLSRPLGACAELTVTDLRGFASLPPAQPVLGDPNRPAYIVYTSGTSGKPRPVVHAHRAIWARRMMWDGWYGLRSDDVMLHAGAFNWTYTLGTGLMDPWAIGATALIPAEGLAADALPALLAQYEARIFAAAPGVYRRVLREDIPPLPALRHGLSAGEKLPQATAALWEQQTGTPVYEAYGMSECSTFISTCPGHRSTSLGWPQPGRAVALIGADGPVPDGAVGVIGVHKDDPGLMLGYLDAPEETAARFAGDWFLTGDTGRKGPDGAIHYEGRNDDMMNAGGYRVSPIEVEDVLSGHPDIAEVAACEIRIKADTTVIAAFYVATDVLDETYLKEFAATQLAQYKTPRMYIRVAHLPRSANNKILRRQLRQDWETTHGQT